MFHYTVETAKSMEEAISALEQHLQEEKFGVLWQFNIQDKLREKGLDFDRPFCVLEVCNPHDAQEILNRNLMVGYLLPCKIVVYEDEGKTKVGLPKPTALMNLVGDEGLLEKAKDVEQRLIQCLDQLK